MPAQVAEALATDIIAGVPELPELHRALRKSSILLQKREEEIEAYAVNRAKTTVGLTLKFANRVSGKGDYLDKLGVGRKEVSIYKGHRWQTVKSDEIQALLLQFLDEKQYKMWLYAYRVRILFLFIYYYLGSVLEALGIVEFVRGVT
ncbi:MAG: hypothetical protein QXK18_00390 [Candidatus Bathyarchaeia archaeon]